VPCLALPLAACNRLIHYANADGQVNVFYSTPAAYVAAKAAYSNTTWPVKTDDFFPYADCAHCYWTGEQYADSGRSVLHFWQLLISADADPSKTRSHALMLMQVAPTMVSCQWTLYCLTQDSSQAGPQARATSGRPLHIWLLLGSCMPWYTMMMAPGRSCSRVAQTWLEDVQASSSQPQQSQGVRALQGLQQGVAGADHALGLDLLEFAVSLAQHHDAGDGHGEAACRQ